MTMQNFSQELSLGNNDRRIGENERRINGNRIGGRRSDDIDILADKLPEKIAMILKKYPGSSLEYSEGIPVCIKIRPSVTCSGFYLISGNMNEIVSNVDNILGIIEKHKQ